MEKFRRTGTHDNRKSSEADTHFIEVNPKCRATGPEGAPTRFRPNATSNVTVSPENTCEHLPEYGANGPGGGSTGSVFYSSPIHQPPPAATNHQHVSSNCGERGDVHEETVGERLLHEGILGALGGFGLGGGDRGSSGTHGAPSNEDLGTLHLNSSGSFAASTSLHEPLNGDIECVKISGTSFENKFNTTSINVLFISFDITSKASKPHRRGPTQRQNPPRCRKKHPRRLRSDQQIQPVIGDTSA